jgi:hypothetical protein
LGAKTKNTKSAVTPEVMARFALSHSPNLQQQGEPHGPWTISLLKSLEGGGIFYFAEEII